MTECCHLVSEVNTWLVMCSFVLFWVVVVCKYYYAESAFQGCSVGLVMSGRSVRRSTQHIVVGIFVVSGL